MLTGRQYLLLAAAISEWDTTLRSIRALPNVPLPIVAQLTNELHDLLLLWPGVHLPLTPSESRRVVRVAREYTRECTEELDDLLNPEGDW